MAFDVLMSFYDFVLVACLKFTYFQIRFICLTVYSNDEIKFRVQYKGIILDDV